MKYLRFKKMIVKDFSLEHTIESGQIFRYEKIGEFYFIVIKDTIIKIKQEKSLEKSKSFESVLLYKTSKPMPKEKIKHFFGLKENLPKILLEIDKDKTMNAAVSKYRGLRLINQEPDECLVSFMASACSNIPKIKRSLNLLAKEFGKKIKLDNYETHSFPPLKKINDLEKLKKCSLGFRARRILALNQLNKKYFDRLKKLNYADAKNELLKIDGVGSKIADCVLLFSLNHKEAFPTDVWIERIIKDNYLSKKTKKKITIVNVEEFGKNYFGKNAGYAQQYLYHYFRKTK